MSLGTHLVAGIAKGRALLGFMSDGLELLPVAVEALGLPLEMPNLFQKAGPEPFV